MFPMPDAQGPRYHLLGRVWALDEKGFEQALAQVHQAGGAADRPRCMCLPGGVEMVVARLAHQFILKRMPQSGARHHASCISYEPPQDATGLGELLGDAVMELDTGRVDVRVNFPLTRTSGMSGVRQASVEPSVVKPTNASVSLKALMHLLFSRAGFDRWSPAMAGKRNQWVIHKYLMQAANGIFVKGQALSDRLYVPEPFSQTTRVESARRRRDKLSVLYPRDGLSPLGMVIGEFKSTDVTAGHRRVWIRHMPDAPLMVKEATWQRIEKMFGKLFEARLADTDAKVRLVIGALIRASSEHTYEIDSATIMMTSVQWIPVEAEYELGLIQDLVNKGRRFLKPLRYDAKNDKVFANVLLLDSGPSPKPVYGLSPFMSSQQIERVKRAIAKAGEHVEVRDVAVLSSINATALVTCMDAR
jgi:hypothetical protein